MALKYEDVNAHEGRKEGVIKVWLRCACEPSVAWRATKYAFFVGIILILINHVDHIFQGEVTGASLIKMGLTVLVPYLVSTCSSVGAILELQEGAASE